MKEDEIHDMNATEQNMFSGETMEGEARENADGQSDVSAEKQATTLSEAIAKQAVEEERPSSSSFSLAKILGGDIWSAQVIRKQIWLIVIVVVFTFIYITNRYHVQKSLIEIDRLKKELQDAKYKALSSSSQITEKSRESKVLEELRANKDSLLHMSTQPPYIINIPENEQVR